MATSGPTPSTFGALNGYFGQHGTEPLRTYCDSGIDFITLAFVNSAPENEASGYPGINFASHCWAGSYPDQNGDPSNLLSECIDIQGDIPYCQDQGVKVLLSIGGVYNALTSNYEVTTDDNGNDFAEFLYSAFGPYDETWDGPRPFDTVDGPAAVDGFDFDIEANFANSPYVAMINTFRGLDSSLMITGAPQCPTSTDYFYMKEMIQDAAFDALFIQFYNNPVCDAIPFNTILDPGEAFNYDDWVDIIASSTNSKTAKLFVGLPASPLAAGSGYITPAALKELVCELKDKPHFGGISLWDLTLGAANLDLDGTSYNDAARDALLYGCDVIPTTSATTTSVASTTTVSSATTTSDATTTITADATTTTTSDATTTTSDASTTTSDATTNTADATTTTTSDATTTITSESSTTSSASTTSAVTTTSSASISSSLTSSTTVSTSSEIPTTSSTLSVVPTTSSTARTFIMPSSGWNTTTTLPSTTSTGITSITSTASTTATTGTGEQSNGASVTKATTTSSSSVQMTTSTHFTTSIHTVTKCPPYVVDCPADGGSYVTTEIVAVYTTVCPVTDLPTTTKVPVTTEAPAPWMTSTVYTTSVHTVTACPPEVTDCPVGSVTTETIPLYTTVCPVTATETSAPEETSGPEETSAPEQTSGSGESPAAETETILEVAPQPTTTGPGAVVPAPEQTTTTTATGTVYATIVVSAPSSIETKTLTMPKPSGPGCSGPGCPGAALPTESWTSKPTTAPSSPPTAGASTLAVGLTGLMAMVVVQAFAL